MPFVGTAAQEFRAYVNMPSPDTPRPIKLNMCCPGHAGEVHFAGLHKTVAIRLITQKMEQSSGTLFSLVAVPANAPVEGPVLYIPQANTEMKHTGAHNCVRVRVTWVRIVSVSTESNIPGWDFYLEPETATLSPLLVAHLEQISVASNTFDASLDPTSNPFQMRRLETTVGKIVDMMESQTAMLRNLENVFCRPNSSLEPSASSTGSGSAQRLDASTSGSDSVSQTLDPQPTPTKAGNVLPTAIVNLPQQKKKQRSPDDTGSSTHIDAPNRNAVRIAQDPREDSSNLPKKKQRKTTDS